MNYTLGWVLKCETVNELRRFNTAVTDDGILYQNYVVRAMNPERWAKRKERRIMTNEFKCSQTLEPISLLIWKL